MKISETRVKSFFKNFRLDSCAKYLNFYKLMLKNEKTK